MVDRRLHHRKGQQGALLNTLGAFVIVLRLGVTGSPSELEVPRAVHPECASEGDPDVLCVVGKSRVSILTEPV